MKSISIGVIIAVIIGIMVTIMISNDTTEIEDDSIDIMVTTYPLYEFTTNIVKEKATVDILTPSGVEVHDWEPTPRELENLQRFDMLIYNSKSLEPYIHKIEDIKLVEAASNLIKDNDPHVWLDPLLAKEEVNNILNAIMSIDPRNEQYYKDNARAYMEKLDALDQEFREGLKDCERREFIVLHSAYRYLADRYGLKEIPLLKLPEEDIPASKIREIIDTARANNIDVIYAEENIDDRLVEVLAEEIDAKILTLSPIAVISNEERMEGITYIDKMRSNLENLRLGLGCI